MGKGGILFCYFKCSMVSAYGNNPNVTAGEDGCHEKQGRVAKDKWLRN